MLRERSAGAILFRRDKDNRNVIYYLLLKYNHHWGFPKGNIEKGETPRETAIREIEEETGIKDIKFIEGFEEKIEYIYYLNKNKIYKTVIFYLAETNTEDVKISFEHKDYIWATFKESLKLLSFENIKAILKKAHNKIKGMIEQFFLEK